MRGKTNTRLALMVSAVLLDHGPLTINEIKDKVNGSRGDIYNALRRLEKAGVVDRFICNRYEPHLWFPV